MDKTLYIFSRVNQNHAFIRGFLASSNWTMVNIDDPSDVSIYKDHGNIIVSVHVYNNEYRFGGVNHDHYGSFIIDMPVHMQFSQYLDVFSPKRFVEMLPKNLSAYNVGLQFGLFAADAINEEDYIQYKRQKEFNREAESAWD